MTLWGTFHVQTMTVIIHLTTWLTIHFPYMVDSWSMRSLWVPWPSFLSLSSHRHKHEREEPCSWSFTEHHARVVTVSTVLYFTNPTSQFLFPFCCCFCFSLGLTTQQLRLAWTSRCIPPWPQTLDPPGPGITGMHPVWIQSSFPSSPLLGFLSLSWKWGYQHTSRYTRDFTTNTTTCPSRGHDIPGLSLPMLTHGPALVSLAQMNHEAFLENVFTSSTDWFKFPCYLCQEEVSEWAEYISLNLSY